MTIVTCANCHTQNRLTDQSQAHVAVCGKCRARLPESLRVRALRVAVAHRYWIVLAAIVCGAMVTDYVRPRTKGVTGDARSPRVPPVAWRYPPVPVSQGVHREFTNAEKIAPFRIVTPTGPDSYYVKLIDAQDGRPLMTLFIHGGQSLETEVPLGSYRVKYATGSTWYGEEHLFGPDTRYSEADRTFSFSMQGRRISGYTVELIRQRGGNLRTQAISPHQF